MTQSYLNLRFEQIDKRFNEIQVLLDFAVKSRHDSDLYQALCRSAHVLLVSHFEGLYKEIVKDVIDDINRNINFHQVKRNIFNTHCNYFLNGTELNLNSKEANNIRIKLYEAFKDYPSKLKAEPFLWVDNKNPAPNIIETLLGKFGTKNFFKSLEGSDLDLVFENQKTMIRRLRDRLKNYVNRGTYSYPYTVDTSFYHPTDKITDKKSNTLWEDFLNNFLLERHNIIHGNTLSNPNDNESLQKSKIKMEILIYAFIINLCSSASPMFFLAEAQ
ncbi:hypothetical protein KHS38_11785 [Mucilaginibacter sp. Bleaf8]|uniref:HEPN domain-containing protein n=1 Tax=Mucilaginibacter sp. Bleaf8 TaxID=2834430 RepID=UPI001BCD15CE|nr:HEPN domain-containing protein [Mucilaginibacter sp. Bleaf8]MBS7565086.1 hypothetical protein [Mucilaginibacter sp. Bleaf8]